MLLCPQDAWPTIKKINFDSLQKWKIRIELMMDIIQLEGINEIPVIINNA